MGEKKYDVKYNLENATLHNSGVGDHLRLNNYFSAQAAQQDAGTAELRRLFEAVNQRLDALEAGDREMIAPAVQQAVQITAEIQQGDESEEKQSFLEKRLKAIYAMSQDIGEVIITSLASPAAGIALTIQKIAQKAKAELNVGATS